jgi:hypothetical protein
VDLLDGVSMEDRDTKGDLYEYMLGKIATAGQNGQFRTPRHIICLMVELTAPQPGDVVCDPACGSAGFLGGGEAGQFLLDSEAIKKLRMLDPFQQAEKNIDVFRLGQFRSRNLLGVLESAERKLDRYRVDSVIDGQILKKI